MTQKKHTKILRKVITLILLSMVIFSCDREVSVSPTAQPELENTQVYISSSPEGVHIYIDGKTTGLTTPDTVKWLKNGEHSLVLKEQLFEDQDFLINTTEDSTTNFYYDYASDPKNYGSILLTSDPVGSSIYLNDSLLNNTTPFTITPLFPGTYKIRLTAEGYRSDSSLVSVLANREVRLDIILPDTSIWVTYNEDNSPLANNTINSIYVDNNNLVWLGTRSGIVQKNGKTWNIFNEENSILPNDIINKISQSKDGTYWIGTINGLTTIKDNIWSTYQSTNSSLPGNYITDIDFDNLGNTWVGTGNGLVKINGSNWTVYKTSNSGIPANFITGVSIDKNNNNIWVGTNAFGIARFDGISQWAYFTKYVADTSNVYLSKLSQHKFDVAGDTTLMSNPISTLEVDNNGNVWAGFSPNLMAGIIGGVQLYRNNSWETVDFGLSDKRVRDFHVDKNNVIWISTVEGLIKYIDISNIGFFRWFNSGLPSSDITASYLDKNNILWIATKHDGIVKYKGEQ